MVALDPPSNSVGNTLLAALPPDILAQLLPKMRRVSLTHRQVLYQPEAAMQAVYFTEVGMISLVANLEDGVQAEVGVIGREGMCGTLLLAGVTTAFTEAMVQIAGTAWLMDAGAFRHELDQNIPLRALLLRYGEAFSAQVSQTAACNGRHGLEQRLARWLLMALDRVDGNALSLTQEFMAMMLGVHRPSITVTAGILQRAGLIRYAGGVITVLDRSALEAASCECYAAVRQRVTKLMGQPIS